jgi:hypothetical protein
MTAPALATPPRKRWGLFYGHFGSTSSSTSASAKLDATLMKRTR